MLIESSNCHILLLLPIAIEASSLLRLLLGPSRLLMMVAAPA
jgi:hypothetical protein